MAEQFYTIPTAIGKAKIANSIALGAKVNLKTMKIGDSNGIYYNPSESQTDLVHTVYSCEINSVEIDESNSNWINVVCAIPADVGDFFIREVGIFDDNNDLIAIGKYPETYKPLASNGSTKELYIKMTFEVTNVSSVTLKIDPTVILATKNDINILTNSIAKLTTQMSEIVPNTTLWHLQNVNNIRTRAIIDVQGFYDIEEVSHGKYRVVMIDGTETWTLVTVGTNSFKISSNGEIAQDKDLTTSDKKLRYISDHNKVSVTMLGAKGDGITDDTISIKNAIADCQTNGYILIFPSGYTFSISEELQITKRINIIGYGSEIKAISSVNSILNFNETIYYDGNGTALENRLDLYEVFNVQGLKLNCNNMASKGLLVTKSPKVNYLNLNIIKCQGTSMDISQATESFFDKINIYAGHNTNSIGMLVKSNDCEFSNIHMIDCHTAIKTNSVNIYNNIHAWMMHSDLIDSTNVFFDMFDTTIMTNRLTQCYCDTYHIVFRGNAQKQNIQAVQLNVLFNSSIYPAGVTPYLFYANTSTPDYYFNWSSITNSYLQGASSTDKLVVSNFDVCNVKLDSSSFCENVSGIKKFTNTALTLLTGVTINQHNHIYRDGGVVNLSLSLTINLATVTISNGVVNIGNLPYQILYPIDPQSFSVILSTSDSTNFPEVASMTVAYLQGYTGDAVYNGLLRVKVPSSLLSAGTLYLKCSLSYINKQLTNSAISYSDNN